jgi:hypothetical protein
LSAIARAATPPTEGTNATGRLHFQRRTVACAGDRTQDPGTYEKIAMSVTHKCLLSKARLVCCLVLGTVVLIPAAAIAKKPTPPTGGLDTAAATGSAGFFATGIEVNAQSGPMGENPSGTVTFTAIEGFLTSGPVTCLSVTGNTATINYRDQTFFIGQIGTVGLIDNGGNGPDVFQFTLTNRAPTDCSPVTSSTRPTFTFPFTTGGATVVDAPPLPTSKEQCQNGGWTQFGFPNQGQCIKLVNH